MPFKMKKIITLFVLNVLFLSTSNAAPTIRGLWQAENANVQIEVQDDYAGIKVRRTDENRWYFYEFDGNGTYRNNNGAKYQLYSDDELIYINTRKNQRIRFIKNNGRDAYGAEEPWYYHDRRRISYISAAKLLDGLWISSRSGDRISVDRRGRDLFVRINGLERLYRPTSDGFFEDIRGNRLKLSSNNRAVLEHRNYRRPLALERVYTGRPGRGW
jgi:hypothetical protein